MFKRIPGTKDILPDEISWWQGIETIARNTFSIYNYKEIRPPLVEEAALFNRSLGASAEIVQKQMFIITNKEDVYALRPEGTASIVRAYIENSLDKTAGFSKFYYIGPMFRLERPQKGRLRQFHHIGCEAVGSQEAHVDVEIISLADSLLKSFSLEGYKIKLNSLGCAKDKIEFAKDLRRILTEELNGLCVDCQRRFEANALRILDCKNESCKAIIGKLNIGNAHLCEDCSLHFQKVKEGLEELKIDYEISPLLVRGLDYYTRTVFEITHADLGAQDAVGAGGRYNNLVKDLGGPDVGAMGFAFGVERLLLAAGSRKPTAGKNLVYLITLGDEAKKEGLKILNKLRRNGITCDTEYEGKSLKGAMRAADDLSARYVLIFGENELKKNSIMLKDMASGEQKEIGLDNVIGELTANNNK